MPCGRLFLRRFVVEDIEYARGKIVVRFVPSHFEIFLPVLCPWPAIVVDKTLIAGRQLSRPAVDVDDIRQALHVSMAKVWAVETCDASPMRCRPQRRHGALVVVAMGMADDHIFNVTGICAKAAVHMTSSETANTQNDSVFIMVGT